MFKKCLESIRDSDYKNVARVIVVVDGNDAGDEEMADVFKTVYGDNVTNVDFVLSETAKNASEISSEIDRNICVLQPHRGKRESLYTGFGIASTDPSVHAVVLVDSDTLLEKDAILEVVYPLACDPRIKGVAGECKIWNTNTLMSMLVAWRYWSAFNIERGAQSFFKTVQCIGGPLGAYTMDGVQEIKDAWITQTFLGNKCTYGDDRRLTNELLMRGHKVVYTPFSVGWSDSPIHIGRYIRQQTRWSKSWCREIWYTLFASRLHGFAGVYLAFECLYQITYFFLVMYLFVRLFVEADIRSQTATVVVSTAVALAKSSYFALRSRNITALFFVLYTFIYFFCMIPARLTAVATMWDVSWGTRGENAGSKIWQFLKNFGIAFLWWAAVIAGAVYSIVNNWYFDWSSVNYRFALVGICSYVLFVLIMLVLYFVGSITRFNHTAIMKQITKERTEEHLPQP